MGIVTLAKVGSAIAALATTASLTPVMLAQTPLSGHIRIDGASAGHAITEAMAEDFIALNPNVDVTSNISGTGGGFRKFCAGETDINNASRPIKESELVDCAANGVELVEFLVAIDAVTIVVSQSNSFLSDITFEELYTIWAPEAEGTVTRWNQVNPAWPDESIQLHGPGLDSGTFDFFTEEVNGQGGAMRSDFRAYIDHNNIVAGIHSNPWAIGYVGLSYYLEYQYSLQALSIEGFHPTLDNAKAEPYPLARPLFIYVSTAALEKPEVNAFVEYYLTTTRHTDIVTQVGYIPLTAEEYYDEQLFQLSP